MRTTCSGQPPAHGSTSRMRPKYRLGREAGGEEGRGTPPSAPPLTPGQTQAAPSSRAERQTRRPLPRGLHAETAPGDRWPCGCSSGLCPAPASRSWTRSGAHGAGRAKSPSPARGGVAVQLWRPCRRPPPCGARALLRPPVRHSLAAGFPVSWVKLHTFMAEPGKSHKATSPCLFTWGHPGRSAPV